MMMGKRRLYSLALFPAFVPIAATLSPVANPHRRPPILASADDSTASPSSSSTATTKSTTSPPGSIEITVPKHYKHSDVSPTGNPYPSPLHSIHVQPLLTAVEAAASLQLARDYADVSKCWDSKDSERHSTYATVDFPIEECEPLAAYLEDVGFHNRILDRLANAYGLELDDLSYLDFFCANYEAKAKDDDDKNVADRKTMNRLDFHRDGSLLSFTVLLTPPSDFKGGGTIFDALKDVEPTSEQGGVLHSNGVIRPNNAGDCCLHSGKMLHGADPVTSGKRTVLVAFVDVAEWCQRPEVLSLACRDWGRMDVASYRLRRQESMIKGKAGNNDGDEMGWKLNNSRWVSERSVRGYAPAFETVQRRGGAAYQRRKKLETEDILLRDILLHEDEREDTTYLDGGITVL